MKKQRFNGPMGHWMQQYLALRRSMGYIYCGAEYGLDAFDRFLGEHFPTCTTVTREMVIDYLTTTTRHLSPLSRTGQITILRQFCRFMLQFDGDTYLPERGLTESGTVQVKPHIFTEEEITRVMQQALRLNVKSPLLPQTYRTIVGLLWVTGMRIGELVRLQIQDLNVSNDLLYIRQTKFHKSRAIPLLSSTTQKILDYLALRSELGYGCAPETSLFINNRGKPCTISTTPKTLRLLICRAGITTVQGNTPRVHDIRHSFATRWLTDIYLAGKDPNIYVPVLATYMGHASIANTQVYLHPSNELMHKAGAKLHTHIQAMRGQRDE